MALFADKTSKLRPVFVFALAAVSLPAQTFTVVQSFSGANGGNPLGALVQADNGSLYGTTFNGGANQSGTVFELSPTGTLTSLYSFCDQTECLDGENPSAGLVQATTGEYYGSGELYGTTYIGGNGAGTVFRMSPSGKLITLYRFCAGGGSCTDGSQPYGLIQAANRDFYGTTYEGGANGAGTVFRITPQGALTTLYSFCSLPACGDGGLPLAGLVQASNGDLYGTNSLGGTEDSGTIFRITLEGVLTTIYRFCSQPGCVDGANPAAAPVQGSNGELYGTTQSGGVHGAGTVFEVTPSGTLTTLHSFCSQPGCADGQVPATGLIQATNGLLYGTTAGFEFTGPGTIFELTLGGALRTVYNFCSQPGCADGSTPDAALVQDTDGQIYGTTTAGGTSGDGTIFSLSIGLNPFVELLPTSAKVGDRVDIRGTNLTGATSVTFDGVPAAFTVVSATQITATVPSGATTGGVEVLTPGVTLKSNTVFVVRR